MTAPPPRSPLSWAGGLLLLLCLSSCQGRDEPPPVHHAASPAFLLREMRVPAARYVIAEVMTIEREVQWRSQQLRHDVELNKLIAVEVVQVDPSGGALKYRKHFKRLRQRVDAQLPDQPPEADLEISPLEGRTVDFTWRGDRWEARTQGTPPVDPPQGMRSRRHPLLPTSSVRQGDRWRTLELPFSLPSEAPSTPHVEMTLEGISSTPTGRLARVKVEVELSGDPTTLQGTLQGFYLFDLSAHHFIKLQLSGELSARSPDGQVKEKTRLTIYREERHQ